MLPRSFSREVVRDLLGIARALFRAERAKLCPDPSRLAWLEDVGKRVPSCSRHGSAVPARHLGGRTAYNAAVEATEALGQYVADVEPIAVAVAATAARLRQSR